MRGRHRLKIHHTLRLCSLRPFELGVALLAIFLWAQPLSAQLRIVDYNIADLQGDLTSLQNVIEDLHADDKPGFAVPVSLFVFQEVHSADLIPLENIINAAAPPAVTYTAGTYTNNNEDDFAGAQAMFYRSDMLIELTAYHVDIYTQAGRYSDRWRLQLVGYDSPDAWFYIYSSHLKASMGADNEAKRLLGATSLRANADALPVGTHIIFAGDMNFYTNTETGYQKFISTGNAQAIDALGSGSWSGAANAIKHSQSPLLTSVNGLVGGGMNDRFDQQHATAAWHDNDGLSIIPGTYRSLGNDGMHYNMAINTGNNFYYPGDIPRSNALADNLNTATDHVPVVCDYQIPAIMTAAIAPDYGRIIQGAIYSVGIAVTNNADVDFILGADQLNYTAAASLGLSGSAADSVDALGDVSTPSFVLDTTDAGPLNGQVTLTSANQGVQNPTIVLNTSGTIIRHSNPSFFSSSDVNKLNVPMSYDANTGVHNLMIDVNNFDYDALQALLDVDSVSRLSSPFSYVGGAASGIGSAPDTLTFSFDTTGLRAGTYTAPITIFTSDENLPGEAGAALSLTFSITIGAATPCPADITGDNIVNVDDLLAVINAWGPCPSPPPPDACPSDIAPEGGDLTVNVDDLLAVIAGWGVCP